jgi:hypothetical protein
VCSSSSSEFSSGAGLRPCCCCCCTRCCRCCCCRCCRTRREKRWRKGAGGKDCVCPQPAVEREDGGGKQGWVRCGERREEQRILPFQMRPHVLDFRLQLSLNNSQSQFPNCFLYGNTILKTFENLCTVRNLVSLSLHLRTCRMLLQRGCTHACTQTHTYTLHACMRTWRYARLTWPLATRMHLCTDEKER